jgi:hypothetical protein
MHVWSHRDIISNRNVMAMTPIDNYAFHHLKVFANCQTSSLEFAHKIGFKPAAINATKNPMQHF